MKVCDAIKRKEITCRPYGCSRYDCEKNKVTYEEALKRYKEHYPDQARNIVIEKMDKILLNQAIRDVRTKTKLCAEEKTQ